MTVPAVVNVVRLAVLTREMPGPRQVIVRSALSDWVAMTPTVSVVPDWVARSSTLAVFVIVEQGAVAAMTCR